MDKTVDTFPKNKFQEVRVGIREFKNHNLLDIRIWTMSQRAGGMVPTGKGTMINVYLLPRLMKALQEAQKILEENKMI